MSGSDDDPLAAAWPPAALRLTSGRLLLRAVREADLPLLARLLPDDYEHDPRVPWLPGADLSAHRARLVHQEYWRARGTWSPEAWTLSLVVVLDGEVVGLQSLEAERFATLRTVDSGSWLVPAVRGRGVGVAMRAAVLTLAFDHLGAELAVSSARPENAASLGVSRHLGYRDNGLGRVDAAGEAVELAHLRLSAEQWHSTAATRAPVRVEGLAPCLPWFGAPVGDDA